MGMSNIFAAFLMLLLTVSGGNTPGTRRNDLLDMIPTPAYWRAKNVTVTRAQLEADIGVATPPPQNLAGLAKNLESLSRREDAKKQLLAAGAAALDALQAETQSADPEAAAMAKDIIDTITQHGKEQDVRRLMAIRTLGERKEKDSLPLLKSLADSKELFVADYAARAISQIEGTPLKPVELSNPADDLKLLPASTGIVGQTTGLGMPGFNLEALVAQMLAINPPNGPAPNPADKDAMLDNLTRQLLEIAEAVGNCRADSATVAVSADIGGNNDWFIISVRGLYDRQAVANYASKLNRTPLAHDGDMIKLNLTSDTVALFPSNRQLVLIAANPANTPIATVLDPFTEALTTGKPGTLADNKTLDGLLKSIDQTGPLWIACIPSAKMRQSMPIFGAFDTLALTAKEEKGAVKITATARGTGDIQAAVDQFNSVQNMLLPNIKRLLDMSKDFQPLVDAVESAKITADDKGATATATLSPEFAKSVLAAIISQFRLTQTIPVAPPPAVDVRMLRRD